MISPIPRVRDSSLGFSTLGHVGLHWALVEAQNGLAELKVGHVSKLVDSQLVALVLGVPDVDVVVVGLEDLVSVGQVV